MSDYQAGSLIDQELDALRKRVAALEAEEKLAKARDRQLWAMLEAANIEIQRLKQGAQQ